MRFEQIDKKVQEAAEKHHPAYDEKAWQKMEKLLNEHLPVKEDDRRRVFLLILLFLLIGGGGLLLLSKPWNKNPEIASQSKGNSERLVNKKKSQPENTSVPSTRQTIPNGVEQSTSASETTAPVRQFQDKHAASQSMRREPDGLTRNNLQPVNDEDKGFTSKPQTIDNNIPTNTKDQSRPTEQEKATTATQNVIENKNEEKINPNLTTNAEVKTEPPASTQAKTTKPPIHKEKSNWLSGFALLFSAGPDVSKAGSSDLGKVTLAYGAGISYTKNRFTLRTGVYAARKIYTAGAKDYKLSWQPSNIKFEGAEADCYVMEIPVGLYYNFGANKKSNWFAGAGLSSYIMKSEKYNYQFKTSSGTPYYWPYDVKNENKHYFSVLDLSAGYNLHLSKTVSLSGEPYFKIPLSGIGVGKVQLNSMGVLFTVGIKPFK